VEIKCTDTPKPTTSIRTALAELGLVRLAVIYPGTRRYPLMERVEAVPLSDLTQVDTLFPSAGALSCHSSPDNRTKMDSPCPNEVIPSPYSDPACQGAASSTIEGVELLELELLDHLILGDECFSFAEAGLLE